MNINSAVISLRFEGQPCEPTPSYSSHVIKRRAKVRLSDITSDPIQFACRR